MIVDTAQLRSQLEQALHVYSATNKQAGSALALNAVLTFLSDIGIEPKLRAPLVSVVGDLVDDVAKSGNRKPIMDSMRWATAARAIDILKECGLAVPAAARKVSRATGGVLETEKLLEFRRNVRKGRERKEAVDAYWNADKMMPDVFETLGTEGKISATLEAVRQTVLLGKIG